MRLFLLFFRTVLTVCCSVCYLQAAPQQPLVHVPKVFIQNKGQWQSNVRYLAKTGGMNTWVTSSGIRYDFYRSATNSTLTQASASAYSSVEPSLEGNVVDMTFKNGTQPLDVPNYLQNTYYNYYVGADPAKYASHVPLFGELTRRGIYPGIDLRLYFDGGLLRYDVIVAPGAMTGRIELEFSGADSLSINSLGELVLHTSVGDIIQQKLYAYQLVHGVQQPVSCAFKKIEKGVYGFHLGNYDHTKELIIDPVLYSTYLGGQQTDEGRDIGIDPNGDIVIMGVTNSSSAEGFPAFNGPYLNLKQPTDAFVTKFKADLSSIIYSTYYGSDAAGSNSGKDIAYCGAVDKVTGNVTFAGSTKGVVPAVGGGDHTYHGNGDGFIAKLNGSGAVMYSRTLGGTKSDEVYDLAIVPGTDEAVVVGHTTSTDFPTTSGTVRPAVRKLPVVNAFPPDTFIIDDGFVTKIAPTGATVFCSYMGADSSNDFCTGVALDRNNNIVIVGYTHAVNFTIMTGIDIFPYEAFLYGRGYRANNTSPSSIDGFMVKINAAGNVLENGTLIGGNGHDRCLAVDVDKNGYAVICGSTTSTDFGATAYDQSLGGTKEGFVLKININGGPPLFSSYLGGTGSGDEEEMRSVKFDDKGSIVVCGVTNSTDFPGAAITDLPYKGGTSEGVVVQLKPDGSAAEYRSFLGGSSQDECNAIALNSVGIYVTGITYSHDFPLVNKPSYSKQLLGFYDAFVTTLNSCTVFPQAASDTTVCAYKQLTLKNTATGTGTIHYIWEDAVTGSLTDTTTGEYTFVPTVPTTITLTVKDDNCSKSVTYRISTMPVPTISSVSERKTCIGTVLPLTAAAGDPKNIIAWYDSPTATTPIWTGATFTTPPLTTSTTYYVESTDTSTGCSSVRTPTKITVLPLPPEPVTATLSQCGGSTATFTATFPPDVNFRWYDAPKGGNLLYVGRTFTTPTIINTTTSYYLETLDTTTNCTSVKRTEAKVIILPSPQPVITGQNAACVNSSGLKYTVASNPNRSYAWTISPNGTITNGNGTNQVTVSWNALGVGVLSITEKDQTSGCSKDTTYAVRISNELQSTILMNGSPALCEGDSIILDAGAGYTSYKWSSGETSKTITVKQPGSFSVEVADAGGCKGKSNVVDVTVSPKPKPIISGQNAVCITSTPVAYSVPNIPGNTYTWTVTSEGNITNGNGTSSITIHWLTAGTATVNVVESNGICSKDTSFTVAVSSSLSPTVTALSKTTLCEGESVILDAGTFAKYTWSTGETTQTITVKTAGTYTVDVEDAGGCKGKSQPITVTVSPLPTPSITANGKLDFCEGDSVILDAGQFAQYTWSTGATTRTITVKAAGAYSVTVKNGSGCTGISGSENVTVYPLPVASTIAQQGDDSLLAFGIQAGNTLQWKLNGVALPGATGTGIQATQDGDYTIETTSPNGCKVTSNVFGYTKPSTAVLTVAVSPKTIIGAAGETVKVPLVITSSKNVTQATASSFSAELAVESTVLIPATGTSTIDNLNRRIITVNGTRKDGNDTLAIVELKAGLGAVEVSPITLKSVTFTSGKAQVTTVDGEFKLTGICTDGGVRLFKPGSTLLTVATEPNPASDVLTITVTAAEAGVHKVYITNTLGAKESEIYSGEITGTQVIASSLRDIPTGVYFLCVQSPTELVVRRIVIAK
ncbi:MAG: SBBP repeat-containing protein [Candidatus Kapaibacterium sp.]